MLYGVKLNDIDTYLEYGLILLADVVDAAPTLQEKRYQIPGHNGTVSANDALTGYPIFNDRTLTFSLFAGVPDLQLQNIRQQLMTKFHGKIVRLVMPWDQQHYYEGTIQFGQIQGYNTGRIPVSMTAAPYRKKLQLTVITKTIGTTAVSIELTNEGMPTIPSVTSTAAAQIIAGNTTIALAANTQYQSTDLQLLAGGTTIQVKTLSGSGTITIKYQEGTL